MDLLKIYGQKRLSGHFRGTDKINLKIRNVQLQTNLL